ncbi:MATE family efflux transporter [Methylobacterium aquaticum]|uniref:Uncharacterized protein n=1 Tax=Methylobacterium aquaticum TaxID=270351 RepID=A0A0J6T212_9HYPH|nr:hypothetical protein VP06_00780 [Methylobacterium aquaticum]
MVVQTSIGLIETDLVAGLGTDALAGMALVFPVAMLVQMVSAGGIGGGIQPVVSRTLGPGRQAEAGLLAWHAVALALALGVAPAAGSKQTCVGRPTLRPLSFLFDRRFMPPNR